LRGVLIAFLLIAVAMLLSIPAMRQILNDALALVEPVLADHPLLGRGLFVAVSALSAMLAFFSSAVLVPAAVYAWGSAGTILLLWCGWWLGGTATYVAGRMFRKPLLATRRGASALDAFLNTMPANASWSLVLLMQLALPSELPGYVCGLLRVRFRIYATAVAVAEGPYAVGTVLMGGSIVDARTGWFVVFGIAAAGLFGGALWLLRRRLRPKTSAPSVTIPATGTSPGHLLGDIT
jgi:uncharacterized membrane protein YdjX (TVP38/TMEM64 family)